MRRSGADDHWRSTFGGSAIVRRRAFGRSVPRRDASRAAAGASAEAERADPLAVASSLDVLAVCLTAGMAVSTAAAATARSAPPLLAQILCRAADLLALGADPAVAWSAVSGNVDPQIDALLRLARRSSASGVALADAVSGLATVPAGRHTCCRRDS